LGLELHPTLSPTGCTVTYFFHHKNQKNGSPLTAPYGLRKAEAQLTKENYKVATVSPQHIKEHLKDTKVLGIHTINPFGLGPLPLRFQKNIASCDCALTATAILGVV
jgi:hypothetical protein